MADREHVQDGLEEFWFSGKVTRRRLIGYGAGVLGATMLVPAPWRSAFGQAKPYKIGTLQPLSGAGAAGGKTALVGTQMAVDRINKRSEEHTSELQSLRHLVCRLLLE